MSARVLKPVMLCELYKISSPRVGKCNLSSNRRVNNIKKDLFGQINKLECKRVYDENMGKQQDVATKKWGFDFRSGYPLSEHQQYIWEVETSEFIPQSYTLSRAAHVREIPSYEISAADRLLDERAARQNASSSIRSFADDAVEDLVTFEIPVSVTSPSMGASSSTGKRQPKITDYMKERKRLAPTSKNHTSVKRLRSKLLSVIDGNTPQSKQKS